MGISDVDRHYLIDENDLNHGKSLGVVFGTHIGNGEFGDVYCAKYQTNKVALKATHHKPLSKDILESEMEVLKVLKNNFHENVVKIIEIFNNSDITQTWVLMAWVDGQNMEELQNKMCSAIPEAMAKDYFGQLVAGLQFLHSLGIVHRDIKRSNILISRSNGRQKDIIKYIDFGFAKLVLTDENNEAICSSGLGTQLYMAPELMSDEMVMYDAFKSDIYSLGIVLYVMLFNELPFGTSDFGIDSEEQIDLLQKLKENLVLRYPESSDVSETAKQLIENMICCESGQRYSLEQIDDSNWLKN